jgi:hypothetical protein
MAEIRVKGTGTLKLFESDNTSSVTIASPASLGGDRTITLPDANVTLASGTMLATDGDGSSLTGLTPGITAASQWRLTTSATGDLEPIASNWEVNDTLGYSSLGSAMTESSGIFTFPSTGYWLLTFICTWSYSGDSRWVEANIKTTTNDSSYVSASEIFSFIQQTESGVTYANATTQIIFDVTDTAQCKVQFRSRVNNDSTTTVGSNTYNTTAVTFVRLGDT